MGKGPKGKNKKDVLFLCQFFYPEHNSSATLPWDTASYLADAGLSVGALCGYPREYSTEGAVPEKETVAGVEIKRVHYIQLKRGKVIARLINYLSFTLRALMSIRTICGYRCVIVYSNPPILPLVAICANALNKTKIVFVSYDVYPEVAYASSSLKQDGFIAKIMRAINRLLFAKASRIVALTEEMREFLLQHRDIEPSKTAVIPNWAHELTSDANKSIYEKYGYTEKDFIVAYFGNLGICQDVDTMVKAIDLLKNDDHIKFFIVGHGVKMQDVKNQVGRLDNVQIMPFLTGNDFEEALSISSCGIVSLEEGLRGMCAPSKYYSYLQSGMPVISIVESNSYLAKEIEDEEIGFTVVNRDCETLANSIRILSSAPDMCEDMSRKASRLYEVKYAKQKCLEQYETLVSELVRK